MLFLCKQLYLKDLRNAQFLEAETFAKKEHKLSDLFLFIQYITYQCNNGFLKCKKDICIIYYEFKIV